MKIEYAMETTGVFAMFIGILSIIWGQTETAGIYISVIGALLYGFSRCFRKSLYHEDGWLK